jgi:hypothetical protein
MNKSFLLLCVLAASGCTVSTGIKTQGDPRYDLNLSRNLSPNRISHYERKYDIFRGEFVTEAVYTPEHQIKIQINYYDKCIAGKKPFNPRSTMSVLSSDMLKALPDHQIEWLYEQYLKHANKSRSERLQPRYENFANELSEILKERNQNNES